MGNPVMGSNPEVLEKGSKALTTTMAIVAGCGALIAGSESQAQAQEAAPTVQAAAETTDLATHADKVLDANAVSVLNVATKLKPGKFPYYAKGDGPWKTTDNTAWTAGFFPGSLWQEAKHTGDPALKRQAARWTTKMGGSKVKPSSDDIGFKLMPSYGEGYNFTGSKRYKRILLDGAKDYSKRYDPEVKAAKSWDSSNPKRNFNVIIDSSVENNSLLFWAAKHAPRSQARIYKRMATNHAKTTMKNHVRPDGSVYQQVTYDPKTGRVNFKKNVQADRAWARGQAWAIKGSNNAYRETKDKYFLRKARQTANYLIKNLPEDNVPLADFKPFKNTKNAKDSSAGTIGADAILELSQLEPNKNNRTKYFKEGEKILGSLLTPQNGYLANVPKSNHLFNHGTHSIKHNKKNMALVYGDYYGVKAARRYTKIVQ